MHSRIFGITMKKDSNHTMSENNYEKYESFADYVKDLNEEEYKNSLEWLKSYLASEFDNLVEIDVNNASIAFKDGFRAMYEENFYKKITDIIENDDSRFVLKRWTILDAIRDTSGFYIEEEGYGPYTIDDFLADDVKDGETYYFYGALDYHC